MMAFSVITQGKSAGRYDIPLHDGGPYDSHLLEYGFLPISSVLFEEFLDLFLVQIYGEVKKNRKESVDHHSFEAKGGGRGEGTLGGKIEESVSASATTTASVLSRIMTLKLIREATTLARVSITSDYICNYSICSPPPVYLPVKDSDEGYFYIRTLGSDDDDDDDDDDTLDDGYLGMSLLEVFSVVFNKNENIMDEKGEEPPRGRGVSLYGTIAINDGLSSQYIYNRKKEDSESMSPGDTALLLTGPTRPISACDSFCIDVALMDNNNDEVITEGKILWYSLTGMARKYEGGKVVSQNIHDYPTVSIYDKLLATNIDGRSGSVTVNYIVFNDAVEATVEVTLLNVDGADVYGLIQAGSKCSKSTYWSVLFQKKKENDEYIDVRPGQCIPLSRSLVAVDGSSSLKVSAELYDRRHRHLSQDDDDIAKGTVVFTAQSSGTSEKNLSGRYGEIRVKVTWTPF